MSHGSACSVLARGFWFSALCCLGALLQAGVVIAAPGAAATNPFKVAQWVRRRFEFTYLGFTTQYSCYGLRDKLASVLIQLGARRQDLDIHPVGCASRLGRPQPAPSVEGTFYVLEPLAGRKTRAAGARTVHAEWRVVDVRLARSGLELAAQCALMGQIKQKILPLFAARDVRVRSNCTPYQLALPGALLQVKVLQLAPAPGPRAAQAHR